MFKTYDGTNLRFHEIAGTTDEMGRAHAQCLTDAIQARIDFFGEQSGTDEATLDNTPWYARWREREIERQGREFPHMIAETEAIARHSDFSRERLFDLTFGGWNRVKNRPAEYAEKECSLAALTTSEGVPAMLSSLDDPPEIWPAIARYVSSVPGRRAFLTTVRPGTGGAGRGMNDAGLWMGTASSSISATPDGPLAKAPTYDFCYQLRSLLESCSSVADALAFCRQYRFNCNLLFGDAAGNFSGVHQTMDGPREVTADGWTSMANAVIDDKVIYELAQVGLTCGELAPTSRPRNGFLRKFIEEHNHRCTFEEFAVGVTQRNTVDTWSINHTLTAFITLAMPQKHPRSMWVCRPPDPVNGGDFIRLEV